jgi:hypothetical protein
MNTGLFEGREIRGDTICPCGMNLSATLLKSISDLKKNLPSMITIQCPTCDAKLEFTVDYGITFEVIGEEK